MPRDWFKRLSPVQRVLLEFGQDDLPQAVDAILENTDKPDYVVRCFAALFVAAVKADPPWLWRAIDCDAPGVLAVARHARPIKWGELGYPDEWGEIPGRLGWRDWIRAAETAGWIDATSLPKEPAP